MWRVGMAQTDPPHPHPHPRVRLVRRPRSPPSRGLPFVIVRDSNGQALAFVYFEDEPGRRAAKLGFGKLRLHDLRGSHGTNLLRKGRAD